MFFIDKYAPKNIHDNIIIHNKEFQFLKRMAADPAVPHIIFYGPEGSGKKTLLKLFLELLYDEQVHKLTDSTYMVTGSGNSTTEVIIKQSNYHIIIEPNNNNFDRYLIQDVVKEYAKKIPLNIFSAKKNFKTVLINNIDNLSYYAQTSLRRTMEKFSKTCRFIIWCRSLSKVIEPIRSRCYCFRISMPSQSELFELMVIVCATEQIKLTLPEYIQFLNNSGGNIKKLLWMLQLKKIGETYILTYDKAINTIVKYLITCDIKKIIKIREIMYNIMITNISGSQIIKDILNRLFQVQTISDSCKINMPEIAAKYEHNLIKGRREITHLDAFIIEINNLLLK